MNSKVNSEVNKMAHEAGLYTKCEVHSAVPFDQLLERFAKLVRADEREACAKVCEDKGYYSAVVCADAIRARGNT
jgi:hypothetical protein